MAIYVYITDQCKETAREHGLVHRIEKLRDQIISQQRISNFGNFPEPFLKKRFSRQKRLIMEEKVYNNNRIIIFREVFVRGNDRYESFFKDRKAYAANNFRNQVNDADLKKWLQNQIYNGIKTEERQKLTEYENRYLWPISEQEKLDFSVCESSAWVRRSKSDKFNNKIETIADLIIDMETSDENKTIFNKNGIVIYGRRFDKLRKIFLAAVFFADNQDNVTPLDKDFRYYDILTKDIDKISIEDIFRNTLKTFDFDKIGDIYTYSEIERNDSSYLALSKEESEVLESVLNISTDNKEGFPLFINGRAGSGKTTVLQYLFAKYMNIYVKDPKGTPPLYLACNDRLIEDAKKIVMELLNIKTSEKKAETKDIFDNSFKEFFSFMYSMLDESDKQKFPIDKYIDYKGFSDIWKEKFGVNKAAQKNYPVDTSWHVIRTYIKGYSRDFREVGYLEPDEYEELPSKEKTVSYETYKAVYENVWEKFYNSDEYWDNQDLTAYILETEKYESNRPVIFADEAQDFTKIELELIMNMSIYSQRNIEIQEIKRLPFAFAGDPFQTLNPTGFRWESIKSIFKNVFIDNLDVTGELKKYYVNYKELSYNFRSSKGIVGFSNVIQLARKTVFDIANVKPQKCWEEKTKFFEPVFLNKGVASALRENSDVIIIIPCEKGQEYEFYNKDEFLVEARDCLEKDNIEPVPRNIFSPASIKGLEFDRVALYKFGTDAIADKFLKQIVEGIDTGAMKETDKLSQEYFINKLYVSATRAKKQLFVIDDNASYEKFYALFHDPSIQGKLLGQARDGKEWRDNLSGVLEKADGIVQPEEKLESNFEQAERFEKNGMENKDPYILRQASMGFEREKMTTRATKCLAYANFYENDFETAYRQFMEAKLFYAAYGSILLTKNPYRQIIAISMKESSLKSECFTKLAKIMEGNMDNDGLKTVLANFVKISRGEEKKALKTKYKIDLTEQQINSITTNAIANLKIRCIDYIKKDAKNPQETADILLDSKEVFGQFLEPGELALLNLKAGRYPEAVDLYKKIGNKSKENTQYYKEAMTKVFEEEIIKKREVTAETKDEMLCLIRAHVNSGNPEMVKKEYGKLLKSLSKVEKAETLTEYINNPKIFTILLKELIYDLFYNNNYNEIIYFSRHKHLSGLNDKLSNKMTQAYDNNRIDFNRIIIYALSNLPLNRQRKSKNSELEKYLDRLTKEDKWADNYDINNLLTLYDRLDKHEKITEFCDSALEKTGDKELTKDIVISKALHEIKRTKELSLSKEEEKARLETIEKDLNKYELDFSSLPLAKKDREFVSQHLMKKEPVKPPLDEMMPEKQAEPEKNEKEKVPKTRKAAKKTKREVVTSKLDGYEIIFVPGDKIKLRLDASSDVSIFPKTRECKSVDVDISGDSSNGFAIKSHNISIAFGKEECVINFAEYGIRQSYAID